MVIGNYLAIHTTQRDSQDENYKGVHVRNWKTWEMYTAHMGEMGSST